MRILITAGPTREYLDPVRFISNGSTGKMGYACAAAAVKRGHQVTLISGPVNLPPPKGKGLRLIKVVTSAEMAAAVTECFDHCDCVIMTAAVGDYKPARISDRKIIKGDGPLNLELVRTIDILATLGATKKQQKLIGFAVQDQAAKTRAKNKLITKNLDAVVLNGPAAMGADRSDVWIFRRGDKRWMAFPDVTKSAAGLAVVKLAERIYDQEQGK